MKKIFIITKSIFQVLLYTIEVIGVAFLGALIFNYLKPINSTVELIERMILSFTVYQILVLVILTNLNDVKKDSYLNWINTLKLCLIYSKSKDKFIRGRILNQVDYQLDKATFNCMNIIEEYKWIKSNLDNLSSNTIEYKIIVAENCYEMCSLNWRFSFLLKMFK